MAAPTGLRHGWEGGHLTVRIHPRGPVPAASVAALTTAAAALAFLTAMVLHGAGHEGLALLALAGVPTAPLALLAGLPAGLRRWRERAVCVVVRSPALLLGGRRLPLDELIAATPVLTGAGYALRLETRRGAVELPLGGHDLETVRWLWAAVERQRRMHQELPVGHRDALGRLESLRRR